MCYLYRRTRLGAPVEALAPRVGVFYKVIYPRRHHPAETHTPPGGLLYKALDPHRLHWAVGH